MEHPVPMSWPQEPEFDGGTMAFFHIDWKCPTDGALAVVITPQTPVPTGFDWRQWTGRREQSASAAAEAKLADR
jgi:hypothetical protein